MKKLMNKMAKQIKHIQEQQEKLSTCTCQCTCKTASVQQTDPVTYPLPSTPSAATPTSVHKVARSSSSFVSTPTRHSFEATPMSGFQSLVESPTMQSLTSSSQSSSVSTTVISTYTSVTSVFITITSVSTSVISTSTRVTSVSIPVTSACHAINISKATCHIYKVFFSQ